MKTKSLLDAYHQVHLKPTTKNVCGTALDTADLDTKRISLSEAYSNMPSAPEGESEDPQTNYLDKIATRACVKKFPYRGVGDKRNDEYIEAFKDGYIAREREIGIGG